jgi:hypothetical protein
VSNVRLFADETGNFDFSRGHGASKYFGVGTLIMKEADSVAMSAELSDLRYRLTMDGKCDGRCFHATTDRQGVRDEVFSLLMGYDFEFDVTMLEKSKALPRIRLNEPTFFKYAWYYHFKYQAPRLRRDELIVIAADLNIKKQRSGFQSAITDVVAQCMPGQRHHVGFWPSESEHGLQAADYCLWAIQRKFERNDKRSYEIIKSKVRSEFDLFRSGTTHHY